MSIKLYNWVLQKKLLTYDKTNVIRLWNKLLTRKCYSITLLDFTLKK